MEEYMSQVTDDGGDHDAFNKVEQPVYISQNAYFNGAEAFDCETINLVDSTFNPNWEIVEDGSDVYLSIDLPENFDLMTGSIHSTDTLGRVRIVDVEFENPDGSKLVLNTDLLGNIKSETSVIGPLSTLRPGKNYIKVWDGLHSISRQMPAHNFEIKLDTLSKTNAS
jgi:hypothetical protein